MFKKTLFLLLCLGVMAAHSYNFFSIGGDDLPGVSSYYDGPLFNNELDTGVTCSPVPPGVIRDDGSYENGYRSVSTGDSTTMVHKMVLGPGSTIVAVCWTWTALSPSGSLIHDIVIYDTTGAGGQPGNLVGRIAGVSSPSIAIFPSHSRYRSPTVAIGPLPDRSYYVGVKWNNNPILPFFSSADENGTFGGPGYQRVTTTFPPVWQNINTPFPNWKNWSFRVELQTTPPAGTVTICRNRIGKVLNDHSTIKDTIAVNLLPSSRILDLIVRVDTLLHTWDSDVRAYIQLGALGTRMINNVGGSGDNFIGTNIKDSAALCQIGQTACNTPPFTGTFRPSIGYTFATFLNTSPNGNWILTLTDTVSSDTGLLQAWCLVIRYDQFVGINGNNNQLPTQFSLSQNYPNPFNPSTTVEFSMPKAENVTMSVYDITGKEVYRLINNQKYETGTHQVIFDMTKFASGVYFYKLEAGSFAETKKMMLIK